MLNFNKIRFIVYEIFDNSQLFLTDSLIAFKFIIESEKDKVTGTEHG